MDTGLPLEIDVRLRKDSPAFYTTWGKYVILTSGWTHPKAVVELTCENQHYVPVDEMSLRAVRSALKDCAPCHCAMCVKGLLDAE